MRAFAKSILFGIVGMICHTHLIAQETNIPLNPDYHHLIERYEIKQKSFSPFFFTTSKPYTRKSVARYAQFLVDSTTWSKSATSVDRFNIEYLLRDNWEWTDNAKNQSKHPIGPFYKKQSDAFFVDEPNFDLHISPVLHLSVGSDNQLEKSTFINTRGVEARGIIGKKLGFYSFFSENQARFPAYVQEEVDERQSIPGEGFWKRFRGDGYDFFNARGYLQFKVIDEITAQFGHDRNFIGNGIRSLFLSDFSNNYLFLKFQTKVWKLNYTNIFARLVADGGLASPRPYPRKFMALHHLSLNLSDNFNIGLFESVILARQDSLGNNQFDVDYLNPIIFYRAVEHDLGDVDNAGIGMDFKWNIGGRLQLYGQFFVDDFNLSEWSQNEGWFGNKVATQLGAKYIDALNISNLDLQLEYNVVTPYTYSHFINGGSFTNYQHFNQVLAHPMGANFKEYIGTFRYQPLPRLQIIGKGFIVNTGRDRVGENWGSNIFLNYETREQDYNNRVGQGLKTNLYFADLRVSYQLRHNLFLEAGQLLRRYDSEEDANDTNTSFTRLTLRLNIAPRLHDF